MFSSKAPYLAKLHSFFEVGPNAFTLLNRAAGLKQLNSIDEIFRELVLDDHSAFDDAQKVVDGFAELASIHADWSWPMRSRCRCCRCASWPRESSSKPSTCRICRRCSNSYRTGLPPRVCNGGASAWRSSRPDMAERASAATGRTAACGCSTKARTGLARPIPASRRCQHRRAAREHGPRRKELARIEGNIQPSTKRWCTTWGWARTPAPTIWPATKHKPTRRWSRSTHEQAELQAQAEHAIAQAHNAHTRLRETQAEYDAVRQRPGSNLPMEFQRFRAELADHLGLPETDLPFAAELIEVRQAEQAWRGAIERALGSHRLRILVPQAAMHTALQWVNQRHNRLHVRLLEVRDATPATFLPDGFARKLNLKPATPAAHLNTLRHLLS